SLAFAVVHGSTDPWLFGYYDRLSAPFGLLRFATGQAKKVQAARGRELARRFPARRPPRS
ncbi:hypothetical protein, partial [Streptosporangium sp. NPDC048865]|uniref:hypothetical protein n=1 Tax=Streptosporangium sp. NPDC048865 TaxID=3155766 RepID=UPI003439ABE2